MGTQVEPQAMKGQDLKEWRKRNGYTQERLREDLELGSRQTIITWEKSPKDLSRMLQLALKMLESEPPRKQSGRRIPAKVQKEIRRRGERALRAD